MKKSERWIVLLASLLLAVVSPHSLAQSAKIDAATRDALVQTLNDERHAKAFYTAVIRRYGEVRPFSNIVNAEKRHEQALLNLFDKFKLTVPTDPWKNHQFAVPDTLKMACREAVKGEQENIALYERLFKVVKDPEIREVFRRLRDASQNNHLPAFKRCAEGRQRRSR